jgi:diaminopimelate decarboxylase
MSDPTTDVESEERTRGSRGPWPENARFGPRGLEVAGALAEDLARRYGTPLLLVDEADLRIRCRSFGAAFPRVHYAVKAFTARAAIRVALDESLGLLAATGGELLACLRAAADPSTVALHGNNKSDEELELAVRAGIGLVIADNEEELERLDRTAVAAGNRQPVLVRVIPGVAGGTHSFIETGELDSKFGTPVQGGAAMAAVRRAVRSGGLEFRGLHAHIGSQLLSTDPYLSAIDVLLDLAAQVREELGATVEVLDVGGGFGATYTDEVPPAAEEAAEAILPRVREGAARRGLPAPEVMVEPGRALVANAVLTLYRVGSVKRIPGVRTFVAVDGGMSDNIRPVLYGARYRVAPAGIPGTEPEETVTVVGKHCESGDVVATDVPLPFGVRRGDLLAIAATGAYGYSMASNYNRVGRPAVVGVRDGDSRLWLRRETDDDLDRLEADG